MDIPLFVKVEQSFCGEQINNIEADLFQQLEQSGVSIPPGASIAIAAGSRGIANIPLIVKTVVAWVKSRGGVPFIIPAMGSHGNGIAAEQKKILEGLGITEE